jgi:hypothetical protein
MTRPANSRAASTKRCKGRADPSSRGILQTICAQISAAQIIRRLGVILVQGRPCTKTRVCTKIEESAPKLLDKKRAGVWKPRLGESS